MLRKIRTDRIARFRLTLLVITAVATVPFLGGLDFEDPEEAAQSREEMERGKCYNCDPPEIRDFDETAQEATLRTDDQSAGGFTQALLALSYFAGMVKSYVSGDPGSGYATTFMQSNPASASKADWFYNVLLAAPYDPAKDVGIALRKVDEPASPQKGEAQRCPQSVPNREGSFIEIDPEVRVAIMERFEICRTQYSMDWQECHYGLDPPFPPMIRMVKITVPDSTGCSPVEYDVCAEVGDVVMEEW